ARLPRGASHPALECAQVGLRRQAERAELTLHLALDDLAQIVAAAPADLDHLVDRGTHLVAGELALSDQVGHDVTGLGTAELRDLGARLQDALPVGLADRRDARRHGRASRYGCALRTRNG